MRQYSPLRAPSETAAPPGTRRRAAPAASPGAAAGVPPGLAHDFTRIAIAARRPPAGVADGAGAPIQRVAQKGKDGKWSDPRDPTKKFSTRKACEAHWAARDVSSGRQQQLFGFMNPPSTGPTLGVPQTTSSPVLDDEEPEEPPQKKLKTQSTGVVPVTPLASQTPQLLDPTKPVASIFKSPEERRADLKRKHPQLENVPFDWMQEGAYNPGGPGIRLTPPPHTGPSPEFEVDVSKEDPPPHVVDLSTGSFNVWDSTAKANKAYEIDREGPERGKRTRSDVRNYVSLSNEFLAKNPGLKVQATDVGSGEETLRAKANKITRKERQSGQEKGLYPEKSTYVGHVPDPSVSGLAHSPMGFMPITDDANTLVGRGSGIHRKVGMPIPSMVVKEADKKHYRYHLGGFNPPKTDVDPLASGQQALSPSSTGGGTLSVPANPTWSMGADVEHPPGSGQMWTVDGLDSSGQATLRRKS